MITTLTQEYLKQRLAYDPETGLFVWKARVETHQRVKTWNTRYVGTIAGTNLGRYVFVTIDGVKIRAHRLAWLYVYGKWPDNLIDHRNGLKHDNRIDNLRDATVSQNLCNRGATARNTSGHKGVHWVKTISKWAASIKLNGKTHHLGVFSTKEGAAAAYAKASAHYHGDYGNIGTIAEAGTPATAR